MVAPVHTDRVAHVRAIWNAYASGGLPALRELAGPDVEWIPLSEGHPIAPETFYGEWGRRRSQEVSATVHGFEDHGPCVLAHGSLRTFREGGFVDVQPSWVYFFRGGRLLRCVGYATREEALRAISAFRSEE